jgi:hypothetical protein
MGVKEEKNKQYNYILMPAETKIMKVLYYGTNKIMTEPYSATKLTSHFEIKKGI